jgi:tetratricopeptide (TPR) repeat protein
MAASPTNPSEDIYRKGLLALEKRSYQEAVTLFKAAIEQERQEGTKSPRMKYLSYLGLAATLANPRSEEGLKLCEQAVRREFFDPDVYCNLGIALLRSRQKARAFEAFQKGLNVKPGYRRITEELNRYERRSDPIFTFLPRQHPVNVLAGRLRHRLRVLLGRTAENEA